MRNLIQILILTALLTLLSACGGSGNDSSSTTSGQIGNGSDSVSLRWIPPTTRSDGSYLQSSQLAGYRIYMGYSSDNLSPIVDLNDGSITNHSVSNLDAGSYYFAISCYDDQGREGPLSQAVLKVAG